MYLVAILLIFHILTGLTQHVPEDGFCEKPNESCGTSASGFDSRKFILYDVNPPEGFNLRRDVYMRFAIMLAQAHKSKKKLNYQLVLPPWYKLYHWRNGNSKPMPWGKFFDVPSMRDYAPVTELYELFTKEKIVIDRLYVLQNFEDAFENNEFIEKWEINKNQDCYYSQYWGYSNITAKEVICVKFQGHASKLWEIVAQHPRDKTIMFANGEIALHDLYGTKSYWDCRKSMKFNNELVTTAENFIENKLNCKKTLCDTYLAIHWRRRDFVQSRRNDIPSIKGTAAQIKKILDKTGMKKVFIATDAKNEEMSKLEKAIVSLGYEVYFYDPTMQEKEKFKDGGLAIIEQIICSHASYFIGTHESTFTFRIQEEREILGFDSGTTFNRFCPDSGTCEKPSVWRIVH